MPTFREKRIYQIVIKNGKIIFLSSPSAQGASQMGGSVNVVRMDGRMDESDIINEKTFLSVCRL